MKYAIYTLISMTISMAATQSNAATLTTIDDTNLVGTAQYAITNYVNENCNNQLYAMKEVSTVHNKLSHYEDQYHYTLSSTVDFYFLGDNQDRVTITIDEDRATPDHAPWVAKVTSFQGAAGYCKNL